MSTGHAKSLPACISHLQAEPDRRVRLAAQHLADLMQELHGGRWRIQIEHEHGFAVAARCMEPKECAQ